MKPIQTIFYSWQSDLPKTTNLTGIRQCLRVAVNNLESEYEDLRFELEEATRNMPGSPNIPETIFAKISNCDIFICDLTTINNTESNIRKVPNPNVLIELGYAIAILGWSRIIMLFNTNYGKFPDDMPFDIDRHRASPYVISDKTDKSGKNGLSSLLKVAIKEIIEKAPVKVSEAVTESPDEKKRRLDIANLKWLLGSFHITTFDTFIEYMPDIVIRRIFYYKNNFTSIMDSNSFHLYDKELLELLNKFRVNWVKSLSFSQHYFPDNSGENYRYDIPMDVIPSAESRDNYHELETIRITLVDNFKELLEYIRNNYLEIDIEELNKLALEDYQTYTNEI